MNPLLSSVIASNKDLVLCAKCRWWSQEIPLFSHTIEPIPLLPRPCLHQSMNKEGVTNGANSDDGYGIIETGPAFGCIHGQTFNSTTV